MKKHIRILLTSMAVLLTLTGVFASCDQSGKNESTTVSVTTNVPETTTVVPQTTTKAPETTSVPETTTKAPETTQKPETTEPSHTHAWSEWTTTRNATCTEAGEEERICACGEKETKSISAAGHAEVVDPAVQSTCTAEGKTEGKHCSVCNTILVAQTDLPLANHTYDNDEDENCNACGYVRDVS